MTDSDAPITVERLLAIIDETWTGLNSILANFETVLDAGPDAGGWTPRQLLSHIVGAWYRVPIHTGFYLANRNEVPILFGDDYWVAEWETAPLISFTIAMQAGVAACKVLVQTLTPNDLLKEAETPFGRMTLGNLLETSFTGHLLRFHGKQLAAFLNTARDD